MSSKKHIARLEAKLRSYRVPSSVTGESISEFLEALDCPRALTVLLLYRNAEHAQLAKLECNPLDYNSIFEFRDAYAATKFLSKFKDLSLDYDLKSVALKKFSTFEEKCRETNSRFRKLENASGYTGRIVWLHNAVKRKISRLLGDFSPQEFFDLGDWGPGATTLIKSRDASSANKFQFETGITRDLFSLLLTEDGCIMEETYPLWFARLCEAGFPTFQVGNKVVTVPKDATTDRTIAIEPGLNLWFQKAIGLMLSKRLSRVGIDLSDQSINQNLAFESSISGLNATIDFSSASDSISVELVRELLPPRWFILMDSCRSHYGLVEGKWQKWEKFSSMGNGFTFQLQSLIFYAMACCCEEYTMSPKSGSISVYGDDVIIPVDSLPSFSELSAFYGFTLNASKSFSLGSFRESCGSHYFSGKDVKPFYFKSSVKDSAGLYRLANSIRRFSHRRNANYGCDSVFRSLFDRLVNLVPKSLRLRIPETLGDGGFISNFDEATPARARHGVEGYRVLSLVSESITFESDTVGLLLARLKVQSFKQMRNNVSVRDRTRLRVKRSLVAQWKDLGPWF